MSWSSIASAASVGSACVSFLGLSELIFLVNIDEIRPEKDLFLFLGCVGFDDSAFE
jgi:hypothetical protein